MSTSVSLRRVLRRIPAFRSLPGRCLDDVVEEMIEKDYEPGHILWRTRERIDFFGVLQSGEVAVEHRLHGRIIRSVKLVAGDYVQPRDAKGTQDPSSVLARAVTNVRFSTLERKQLHHLQSRWSEASVPHPWQRPRWSRLWAILVTVLILFLIRGDLTRILSGTLSVAAIREDGPTDNVQDSLLLLDYAESVDPAAVFAYNQEGYISFQENDLERSTSAFASASQVERTNSTAWNNLAVIHHTMDQIPEAADFAAKAAEHDPNSAVVRYNLGVILMNQNDQTGALREFREASQINPTWVMPYLQQGFLYLQMQDDIRAERAARTAIRLDPTQGSAHLVLAIALYDLGKFQEALEAVEYVIQLAPEDYVAQFYRALILGRLGEFDSALSILQQLLEAAREPQDVSRIQAEIESIQRALQTGPASAP